MFKGPYLGGPAPLVTSQNPLGSPPPRFSRLPEESADSLSQKLHLLGGTSAKHLHGSAWCFESWAAEFGWNLGICRQLSTYLSPWLLRKLTPGNVWLLVLKLGRKNAGWNMSTLHLKCCIGRSGSNSWMTHVDPVYIGPLRFSESAGRHTHKKTKVNYVCQVLVLYMFLSCKKCHR